MIVTGLNSNRFLAGNPIPIEIKQSTGTFAIASVVTMTITRLATHVGDVQYTLPPIKLYPPANGLKIDLQEIILGLLPDPYIPSTTYQNPIPNYQRFNITFNESQTDTSATFLNKTFVRGYKEVRLETAVTLQANQVLSPTDKIPIWQSFPSAYFTIATDGSIVPNLVIPSSLTKQMITPSSCNPFYVRFLNSLGGYSFWLFNAWEWEQQTKGVGVIQNTTRANKSLGFDQVNTITLDTRVKREFFPLLRDLNNSPVVQAYNQFGANWLKVELKDGSFTENNYEDLVEFTCKADLMLNVNPKVVW